MTPFADLLQQGAGNAWLFVPSAILLGALHGLEPGHSKTMMAAFIVAVRGTVKQAVLLGLAATLSHTAVVWAVALAGMYFGANWGNEETEPYFQIGSAVLIIAVALWMVLRTWRDPQCAKTHDHDHHDHGHADIRLIDLDHWMVALEVFETGVPPRFRLRFQRDGKSLVPPHEVVTTIETERPDGGRKLFSMVNRGEFLESVDEIPEPHEFVVRLKVVHDGHSHDYDVEFTEHDHAHVHPEYGALDIAAPGYQDAHELAHANDIRRRFTDQNVTTGQIIMFGLTGGLIPCPASITVLLLCLQLRQFTLGVALVLCFSIGLAATMVLSGSLAALSVRHVSKRWSGFGEFARRAPYFSSALVLAVGAYTGYMGWVALR